MCADAEDIRQKSEHTTGRRQALRGVGGSSAKLETVAFGGWAAATEFWAGSKEMGKENSRMVVRKDGKVTILATSYVLSNEWGAKGEKMSRFVSVVRGPE